MNSITRDNSLELSLPQIFSRGCLGSLLALTLSACVYVPVIDEQDAASASCKTYTKSMALETIEMHGNVVELSCSNNRDCAAGALAAVVVVTAGSAIISGSIVLTGNTIHWLEYQGTCSDGYLNKTKQLFLDSIGMEKSKPSDAILKQK